jgi:hypothetical protein
VLGIGCWKIGQLARQRGHAPAAPLAQDAIALCRCADPDYSRVVCIALPFHESVPLHANDQPRHRRCAHLFGTRELPNRERSAEYDNGKG